MIPLNLEPFIFDCEVFAYDWLFVFKNKVTGEYTEIWNDNEAVEQFMTQEPLLAGFNNKHYDQFILKAVLSGFTPEEIKAVNDFIIVGGHEGWEYAPLRDCGIFFDQYDLMDDCQMGLSLKAIEAHLGMDIRETTVPFNIDRPLLRTRSERSSSTAAMMLTQPIGWTIFVKATCPVSSRWVVKRGCIPQKPST